MTPGNYSEKIIIAAQQHPIERNYWKNQLTGFLVKTGFPYEYRKTDINKFQMVSMEFVFSEELAAKLMQIIKESDRALNLLLISGLTLLLGKYTSTKDITIGTPIYSQKMEGDFINTVLVLRNRIENNITFKEFVTQVRQTILDAVRHQNYPIDLLMKDLNIDTTPGNIENGSPLFDVAFLLENLHKKEYLRHIQCNMICSCRRDREKIHAVIEYNSSLYSKNYVEKVFTHFEHLLYHALSNVNLPLSGIEILTGEEKRQLLEVINNTGTTYPQEKTIHQWFEDQVEKTPNRMAVSSPIDLSDIYDQLESQTVNPGEGDKRAACCFKRNSYLYQYILEPPDIKGKLAILKTHCHNSVIVDNNMAELLALFDGKKNLKSIYSQVKELERRKGKHSEYLIYSMTNTDLLEVTFHFNCQPVIFLINGFGDVLKLTQSLYKDHLIELAGVSYGEPGFEESFVESNGFQKDNSLEEECIIEELLVKNKKMTKARVLLLGDTPGISTTGLLYLGSYLRRKGIQVCCQFYDPNTNYTSLKENIEILLENIQPEIVGVSMKWFLYIARVIDMCRVVKEYAAKHSLEVKVVVGGNTASYYWEDIIKYDCIDYLIRGDGEEPLLKICCGENKSNIPNCVYRSNGKIIENPVSYIQNETNSSDIYLSHLDEILLSNHASRFGTFFIYTNKGCTMNCLYCGGCNQAQQKIFNRKGVFRRGVEEVRKDILEAKKFTSTFQFEFDILDTNLLYYCKKIWENIDLSSHFCIFSTLMPPPGALIELVSQAFKYVYWDFDICTLSERHRKQLISLGLVKPLPADDEILEFLTKCEGYNNIEVRLNLITGLPYFTPEDIGPSEALLSKIMNTYSCFGELHWARLHAQPGAPILENPGKYHMHSYATSFDDFLKYSKENFGGESIHPTVENFNYPYIYFDDEKLNSRVTKFYLENNQRILQNKTNKKRDLIVSDQLTYSQLNEKIHHLAIQLRTKGVGPGKIVGIMPERTIAVPVAIFGTLKTGAAYLPIDPEFPTGRIEYLLKDSGAGILISGNSQVQGSGRDREMLHISETATNSTSTSNPAASPDRLAYIIYTSGTTGKPKGVLITHKNLFNYVHWFTSAANIQENDKTTLTSSFAFDLGYTSLYTSLLKGGELHILPREVYLLGERFLRYIRQRGITYLKVTPSLFSVIVNSGNFSAKTCKSLRLAAIGGEAINVKAIEKAHALCPHIRIMNHYGPTEATIGCVATFIDFDRFNEYKKFPVIGKPINNTNVYIVGKDLNLMPVGIPGELCISGDCLAQGYLNHPQLTAEKFPPPGVLFNRPGLPALPNTKLYRTGDLARWLHNGNIEFLGRIDKQVKIRGYRIELGEIEERLRKHPAVANALVISRSASKKEANQEADEYLCVYVVPRGKKNEKEYSHHTLSLLRRFENKVERNPNKTAIISNGQQCSYGMLDRYAAGVAREILENYDDRYHLSNSERERYKRQTLLHGWGLESQEKLKSTTVFVAGAGGGGSPIITQLALLGFGTIKICDCDEVELSNLNRQFLHNSERLGMNKALSAKLFVNQLNPHVKVIPYTEKLTPKNVFELVGNADIIFDMLDNPEDKFTLSQCAVVKQIPHVTIAMNDLNAYTVIFHTPHTPCYHCIFDKKKYETIISGMKNYVENYSKNPLAVAAPSLFTSAGTAVTEVLKILLGFNKPAYNKFFYFNQRVADDGLKYTPGYQSMTHLFTEHFRKISKKQGFDWDDGWRGKFMEELTIEPDPHCPVCGKVSEKPESPTGHMKKVEISSISLNATSSPTKVEKKNKQRQSVALLITYDIDMAAAILGILKAGKSNVPLDPASSLEEQGFILGDAGARVILTDSNHLETARTLRDRVNKNIKIIEIDKIDKFNREENPIEIDISPGQTACILYSQDFAAPVKEFYEALSNGTAPYLLAHNERKIKPDSLFSQLREYLGETLPDYMIPSHFIQLEKIPLTPNGKVDINALPGPGINTGKEYTSPRNEVEEKLVEIWSKILETDKNKIGIDTNFFELGGHSLNAAIMVARIHSELGMRLPIATVFEMPTIREISSMVAVVDWVEDQIPGVNQEEEITI